MWNLGFLLVKKNPVIAFMIFFRVRLYITFNNIFMAPGYGLGKKSVWGEKKEEDAAAAH